MLKSLIMAGVLGTCLLAAQVQAAGEPVLKIVTEGAYAPWNFIRPGGKLDGFEIELAQDLCNRMAVRCEMSAQEWDGLIPSLNAGKFDAIMAGMSITPQRQEVIGFSRPYAAPLNSFLVMEKGGLAALPGDRTVIDLDKDEPAALALVEKMAPMLKGKVLGVQGSTTAAAFAAKYLGNLVEVREYKTVDAHNLDLLSGRIDMVLANAVVLKQAAGQDEMKGTALAGPIFAGGVFGPGIAVGLRKNDTDLKARFDRAISAAVADGTLKKLSEKWLKLDVTPRQ